MSYLEEILGTSVMSQGKRKAVTARASLRSDSAQQLHPGKLILQPPANAHKGFQSLQKTTLQAPSATRSAHRHGDWHTSPSPAPRGSLAPSCRAPAATMGTQGSAVDGKQSHFGPKAEEDNPLATPRAQHIPLHPPRAPRAAPAPTQVSLSRGRC